MINKMDEFIELVLEKAKEKAISIDILEEASSQVYGEAKIYLRELPTKSSNILTNVVWQIDRYLDKIMMQKLGEIKAGEIPSISSKVKIAVITRIYDSVNGNPKIYHNVFQRHCKSSALRKIINKIPHFASSIESIWLTVDTIWKFAGDTATDWNYYSKRGILYAIYAQSMLYYLKSHPSKEMFEIYVNNKISSFLSTVQRVKKCFSR